MGISRIEVALILRTNKLIARIIIKYINFFAKKFPQQLIWIIPKSICTVMSSSSLLQKLDEDKCFGWADRASRSKFSGHRKAGFYVKLNYAFIHYTEIDFQKFVSAQISSRNSFDEKRDFYRIWAFHNIGQYPYSKHISKVKTSLEDSDFVQSSESYRFLPEHTTNMGHLASLFLYANFYRNIDPQRKIMIWPDISPNRYYLNKLLEIFPLKFGTKSGYPILNELNPHAIDTLMYSRIGLGKWRFESMAGFPCNQDFPEFKIKKDFVLKSENLLDEFAISKLKKLGFDESKWFVNLHVKEGVRGFQYGGETRDADINTYKLACQLVNDLGGQVVRMGGKNFPKLDDKFPAIDYAHSIIRSERIDYWLWANCNFWIGNGNGASVAIITFGKPRLVTNVWPINPFGPKTDLYIPKLIFDKAKSSYLKPKNLIEHKLSRSMKKELFKEHFLEMVENSSVILRDATFDMYNSLKSGSQDSCSNFSAFEIEINKSMYASLSEHVMQLPKSFRKFLQSLE